MKLSQISELINGKIIGEDIDIIGISDLEVQKPNTIAFADNKKNLEILSKSVVSAIIIPNNLDYREKPVIIVDDPKLAFIKVLELFSPYKPYNKKIYENVFIDNNVKLGNNLTILPFTTIMENSEIGDNTIIYSHVFIGKNVKIGKNCIIKSGVKIDDETTIGDNVIIHHNAVIGGDGFGYIQRDGKNIKIPQIGKIIIEDNVEIGACVTIDRATINETRICNGTKIDNLVQIAHNVKIGDNSILAAQVGIAGSSTLGKNCVLLGQVGIADHINIGDNVIIMAQSGVMEKKVENNSTLFGTPARNFMEQKRIEVALSKLPELLKRVSELEKKFNENK